MFHTTTDPCFLAKRVNSPLSGLVALQFDDSLYVGNEDILGCEYTASKTFKSKPRVILGEKPLNFKGIKLIRKTTGTIDILKADKIR